MLIIINQFVSSLFVKLDNREQNAQRPTTRFSLCTLVQTMKTQLNETGQIFTLFIMGIAMKNVVF